MFDSVLVFNVIFVKWLVDLDDASRGNETTIVGVCLQLAGIILVFLVVGGNDGIIGRVKVKRL